MSTCCVHAVQILFVGGLFPPFMKENNSSEYYLYEFGGRWMAAVQMAIAHVNERTDLLPGTQVCFSLFFFCFSSAATQNESYGTIEFFVCRLSC